MGTEPRLDDRVDGCVLGLALGDALGAPFEFRRRDLIPRPLPPLELPWMGRPPGTTTDDTAMARNLVRSLSERGRFDPDDVVRRHLEWLASDPPDVGALTRRVLLRAARGEPAAEAARKVWEERGPEVSAGNGSVMYCAPLGAAYANRPGELQDLAPALSGLTHADERCRTAVLAVTLAVAALVRGEGPGAAVGQALSAALPLEGGEELEFLTEAAGSARRIDGPDMGFCLFTAGASLQVVVRMGEGTAGPPAEELERVVAMGGDTDTNAAVAGALLGAAVGAVGLPQGWLDRLIDRRAIAAEAHGLVPLAALTATG
jgi:ADP-ribosyl-[dinitrogen reductase] hydrolase